ncbi:hypothetical protein [uncultured Pseudokineococcus sp.]|uniref:hypothetical protein n=1 Tax=uncultured Pseudokineococcus sp. TaxID=1642928 RepID=UPI002632EA90|nr:hypothetical protein [uncultured Pseudokineococcus sp.]
MTHPPSAAVVAATALSGSGTAVLTPAARDEEREGSCIAVLHARGRDGQLVVVASDAAVGALGLGRGGGHDAAARLEVVVEAALPDLTVPRAQVVVDGWVRLAAPHEAAGALGAACAAGDLADLAGAWPDARVLLLDAAAVRLHWPEGCSDVAVEDLRAAAPDPVALREADVLGRVEAELGDRLVGLVRAMGHAHPAPGGRGAGVPGRDLGRVSEVRCVGADRTGLVLRCRAEEPWEGLGAGCRCAGHDGAPCPASTTATLRLLFPAPVADADAAVDALALMVLGASAGGAARCPYAPGAARA